MNNIKNTISLLPHNQKLFDEIMELINNGEHSIFYSEATGLGKSFIFMSLVNELFQGKKVLYIIPKIAIWENMNMYKEFEYIKDCVEMTAYADFNNIKDHHYDYDAIFIDECHHLTSDIQGANILEVCNEYVNEGKYVFGFTATPENGSKRVNSDIYFNSKVYGMDIIEAIESGVFKKIEYAIADPDTIVDDKEYCKKYSIDGTKTLLENIIAERKDIDRWLVYFNNITALHKNLSSIKRLFPDFKIFYMHSKNDNNDEQLKEFNSYKGKSMLLTVSMVLEGVHPEKVGGVLLYRNIGNNTTFLQVLGRICSTRMKVSPLCVDITNSISNIKQSYINNYIYNYSEDEGIERSIKNIIDIKASSYKYIELVANLYDLFVEKEYRGIRWRSDRQLSKILCHHINYVHYLRRDGLSYEQIIDQVLDKSKKYSYKGYAWDTDRELSRLLNKYDRYVHARRKTGLSYEQIIDQCKIYSYKGYNWKTDRELSILLNKRADYVADTKRKYENITYEEIIDMALDKSKKYSYKGYAWDTNKELSTLLNKRADYVGFRKRNGLSYEQIIDEVLNKPIIETRTYRGYTWNKDVELSRLLGKYNTYVYMCKSRGMSYEQIIDHVLDSNLKNNKEVAI